MRLLEEKIFKAEERYLFNLFDEVNTLFKNTWLPSHDAIHHKRVWELAKELLRAYSLHQVTFTADFIEGLLVACMFHDVGLTKVLGFEHGKESAEFASNYLNKIDYSKNLPVSEIIEAIERHDEKSYLSDSFDKNNPTIYDLLTVADDLDAFGALGLYRYFEIYHLRKLNISEIPSLIKDNLQKRFQFVKKVIQVDSQLYQHHLERYEMAQMHLKNITSEDLRLLLKQIDQKEILEIIPAASDCLEEFIHAARKEAGMN